MSDKARNIVILSVIAGIVLLLSVLSYQFSILISNKLVDITSQRVRSNTIIEAHDISQILANKLQTIGVLLQTPNLPQYIIMNTSEQILSLILDNNSQVI